LSKYLLLKKTDMW